MKNKFLLTVLGVFLLTFGAFSPNEAAATDVNVSVNDDSYWYDMGYQDGWEDAVSGRPYLYTQQRTFIHADYLDSYMAGYNLAWQQAGGGSGTGSGGGSTGGGGTGGGPGTPLTPKPTEPGTVN
ncbi:hypothetical protein [Pontibacter actiniarum]|uniref:hypothetical protein n=1 Tax=Pontibacter actiniarum TaxID=323450 RepID=UPI0012FCBC5D|nr:hypothetical protein [Pontibacter actiniarum]